MQGQTSLHLLSDQLGTRTQRALRGPERQGLSSWGVWLLSPARAEGGREGALSSQVPVLTLLRAAGAILWPGPAPSLNAAPPIHCPRVQARPGSAGSSLDFVHITFNP